MDTLINIIEKAIRSHHPSVEVDKSITEDNVYHAIRQVMRENPDIFWFSHQWRYVQKEHKVHFSYTMGKERAEKAKEQIADVIENDFCIDEVKKLTPVEQVMYVYKWLALYCDYNVYSAYNQTIYSVFVYRNSVCTGYAKAAQYLLGLFGFESKLVFGKIKNSEARSRHCWLVVSIEGTWYHLDPTFAVSGIQYMLRYAGVSPTEGADGLIYNYFCVDDASIKLSKEPSARSGELIEDEETLPNCNSSIDYSELQYLRVNVHRVDNIEPMGCRGHLVASNGTTAYIYAWHGDGEKKTVVKVFRNADDHILLNHELRIRRAIGFSEHLINVYGVTNDQKGLILEQTTPLADLLCSHYYQLSAHGLCKLLVDIIDGLLECINHGIYYRDIHLNNIFRADNGTYKLGDFGSCIWMDRDNPNTASGIGSPWYMAPETKNQNGKFDEKSAVYGVAMIAYYLLNDLYPPLWHQYGKDSLYMRMKNQKEIPLPLRLQKDSTAFGKEFGRVILIALQYNPFLRQQSLLSLRQELIETCSKVNQVTLWEDGSCEKGHSSETNAEDKSNLTGRTTKFGSTEYPGSDILVSNGENEHDFIIEAVDSMIEDVQMDLEDLSPSILSVCDDHVGCAITNDGNDDFDCTAGGFDGEDYVSSLDEFYTSSENPTIPNNRRDSIDDFAKSMALPPHCSPECSPEIKQTFTPQSKHSNSFWSRLFGKKEELQDVYSSIFAPSETIRGDFMMVQVFLYKDDEERAVACKAAEVDPDARRQNFTPLSVKLKNGDRVKAKLTMSGKGIEVDEPIQEMVWQGHYTDCQFGVFVPEDYKPSSIMGTVMLTVNDVPCGRMMFKTKIVSQPQKLYAKIESKAFQKIFISYSHKDESTVKYFAKAFQAQGINYFFDRHYLKAGDVYPLKIKEYINSADLFILCWSKNAAESDYVQLERQQALALAFPQCDMEQATLSIHPISIEPHADYPSDMKEVYNFEEI